mgnify:CR=1 FL=1
MILRNLRTIEGKEISIEINQDKIAKIYDIDPGSGENFNGSLVTPPLVDGHAHLDSNLLLDVCEDVKTPKFIDALKSLLECKEKLSSSQIYELAKKSMSLYIKHGTLAIRTHVMIDDTLDRLKEILKLKEEFKHLVDIQVIGFIQSYSIFDKEVEERARKALEIGADGIGGQPHLQPSREDGIMMVKKLFDIAGNKVLDFHADYADDPEAKFTEVIVSEAIRRKKENVSLSHAIAMASYNEDYFRRLLRWLSISKVNVIVSPFTALEESGAFDPYPKRRGLARVQDLLEANVKVALGHDDIQNHLNPYGVGDMLQVGFILAVSNYMYWSSYAPLIFKLMTYNGAEVLGLKNNGLYEGAEASLVIYNARSPIEALREILPRRMVMKSGKVLYESEMEEKFGV